MRVVSGAGEFEIRVERLEVRDGSLVMIGKMGIWESETFIEGRDLGLLLRLSLNRAVLGWASSRPLRALRRRMARRGPGTPPAP